MRAGFEPLADTGGRPGAALRLSVRTASRAPTKAADILVVAHRGASLARAEHTVDAYVAAIASGADGLECDVRLTRDGHLVCVHDRRVNRTSNGTGVVSELDLVGLNELDFSSWRDDWPESADELTSAQTALGTDAKHSAHRNAYLAGVAPDRDAAGGVLTLPALLELVADAGRPLRLLVETKHPTRYAGLVEKELVRTLHRFGYGAAAQQAPGTVAVMSFATTALRRIRQLDPALSTVLIQKRMLLPGRRDGRLSSGTANTAVNLTALRRDPDYVERAHRRGHQVYVWTVDEATDIEFALDLGVDAIISNDPRLAVQLRDNQLS